MSCRCKICHATGFQWAPMLRDEVWIRLGFDEGVICANCMFERARQHDIVLRFADLVPCPFNTQGNPYSWFGAFIRHAHDTGAYDWRTDPLPDAGLWLHALLLESISPQFGVQQAALNLIGKGAP